MPFVLSRIDKYRDYSEIMKLKELPEGKGKTAGLKILYNTQSRSLEGDGETLPKFTPPRQGTFALIYKVIEEGREEFVVKKIYHNGAELTQEGMGTLLGEKRSEHERSKKVEVEKIPELKTPKPQDYGTKYKVDDKTIKTLLSQSEISFKDLQLAVDAITKKSGISRKLSGARAQPLSEDFNPSQSMPKKTKSSYILIRDNARGIPSAEIWKKGIQVLSPLEVGEERSLNGARRDSGLFSDESQAVSETSLSIGGDSAVKSRTSSTAASVSRTSSIHSQSSVATSALLEQLRGNQEFYQLDDDQYRIIARQENSQSASDRLKGLISSSDFSRSMKVQEVGEKGYYVILDRGSDDPVLKLYKDGVHSYTIDKDSCKEIILTLDAKDVGQINVEKAELAQDSVEASKFAALEKAERARAIAPLSSEVYKIFNDAAAEDIVNAIDIRKELDRYEKTEEPRVGQLKGSYIRVFRDHEMNIPQIDFYKDGKRIRSVDVSRLAEAAPQRPDKAVKAAALAAVTNVDPSLIPARVDSGARSKIVGPDAVHAVQAVMARNLSDASNGRVDRDKKSGRQKTVADVNALGYNA